MNRAELSRFYVNVNQSKFGTQREIGTSRWGLHYPHSASGFEIVASYNTS